MDALEVQRLYRRWRWSLAAGLVGLIVVTLAISLGGAYAISVYALREVW